MAAPKSKGERAALIFGILLIVIGMSWGLVDWKGNSAWYRFQRDWEAKGERFNFKDFIPPPVPADRNFALTPIVHTSYGRILDRNGHRLNPPDTNCVDRLAMEIFGRAALLDYPTNTGDWMRGREVDLGALQRYYRALAAKTNEFPVAPQPQSSAADVLLALSRYDKNVDDLRAAAALPDSRFPLNYEVDPPARILLPHLSGLRRACVMLRLRAVAELENGEPEKALDDVKLMLRLSRSIRTEPILVSHLVSIAMVNLAMQPIWEGTVKHRWSDAQLAELQKALADFDFLAEFKFAVRGDRALSLKNMEYLRRTRNMSGFDEDDVSDSNSGDQDQVGHAIAHGGFSLIPSSVFYANELNYARLCQQWLLPAANVEQRTFSPAMVTNFYAAAETMDEHFSFKTVLVNLFLSGLGASTKKFAVAQSAIDQARVACALERYRLAHGDYPETLEALAPDFIDKVPHDVIGGGPLHYRREPGGKFVLYSIGWNDQDDGGIVVLYPHSDRVDVSKGDWVWEN